MSFYICSINKYIIIIENTSRARSREDTGFTIE